MPQLDVSTFPSQLFWLAVTFFVLFLAMRQFALPRVRVVLDARQGRLDSDLSQAAALKAQAEEVRAAYEQALAAARAEAQNTLRDTRERLAGAAAERQRQLAETLARQIEAAEARVIAAKDQALADIRDIAADVARAVAIKLTGAAPDQQRLTAAVARSLDERTP